MNSDIAAPRVVGAPVGAPVMRVSGHPLLRILSSFPIACFCGALVTDIVYALTADMIWADFSAWLLAAGIIVGVIAALAGIVASFRGRRTRAERPSWKIVVGSLVVLVLAFFDNLVHSRDAWTSVVPQGVILSAATVIVMLATAWIGSRTTERAAIAEPTYGVRP
jgi:uncharacterized membrane protein